MGGGLPFFEATDPIDAAAIARIPFLFVHGDRDEVIPSWASERTAKAMRKANPEAVAEVHVLPGRPHDVVYGRDEGLTFPFLEKQAREAFPKQVSLRARTLDAPAGLLGRGPREGRRRRGDRRHDRGRDDRAADEEREAAAPPAQPRAPRPLGRPCA